MAGEGGKEEGEGVEGGVLSRLRRGEVVLRVRRPSLPPSLSSSSSCPQASTGQSAR